MYKIIESDEDRLHHFIQDIEQALKEGWKLQGGVCIAVTPNGYKVYAQALAKA